MTANNAKERCISQSRSVISPRKDQNFPGIICSMGVLERNPELFWPPLPNEKELMRYQTLVFAAFLVVLAAFSAQAQEVVFQLSADGSEAERYLRGGRKADPAPPQVMGRITDFAGRSIKAAEVTFLCVDCDEIVNVRSNAFGYYTVSDLTDGHTYLIAVQHRKYLFLIGSDQVTAGPETFEFNFLGEPVR